MSRTIMLATALSALVGVGSISATRSHAATTSKSHQRTQQAAANPNVPGATGTTIVPGDNSTIAGDAEATRTQQTGAYSDD
jgi:hypothetical protein